MKPVSLGAAFRIPQPLQMPAKTDDVRWFRDYFSFPHTLVEVFFFFFLP